jgi:hypothetical protein
MHGARSPTRNLLEGSASGGKWPWADSELRQRAGAALGPLQIHRGFHRDSRVPGPYERVADLAYARKVATAYYKRYAPGAWERGDVVALARIHQGGPRGHQKAATLPYARKVLAYTRR